VGTGCFFALLLRIETAQSIIKSEWAQPGKKRRGDKKERSAGCAKRGIEDA
jgi:hypothetical protein